MSATQVSTHRNQRLRPLKPRRILRIPIERTQITSLRVHILKHITGDLTGIRVIRRNPPHKSRLTIQRLLTIRQSPGAEALLLTAMLTRPAHILRRLRTGRELLLTQVQHRKLGIQNIAQQQLIRMHPRLRILHLKRVITSSISNTLSRLILSELAITGEERERHHARILLRIRQVLPRQPHRKNMLHRQTSKRTARPLILLNTGTSRTHPASLPHLGGTCRQSSIITTAQLIIPGTNRRIGARRINGAKHHRVAFHESSSLQTIRPTARRCTQHLRTLTHKGGIHTPSMHPAPHIMHGQRSPTSGHPQPCTKYVRLSPTSDAHHAAHGSQLKSSPSKPHESSSYPHQYPTARENQQQPQRSTQH